MYLLYLYLFTVQVDEVFNALMSESFQITCSSNRKNKLTVCSPCKHCSSHYDDRKHEACLMLLSISKNTEINHLQEFWKILLLSSDVTKSCGCFQELVSLTRMHHGGRKGIPRQVRQRSGLDEIKGKRQLELTWFGGRNSWLFSFMYMLSPSN